MIAWLPMYDWPELRQDTDHFWELLRDRLRAGGINAPQSLTHNADLDGSDDAHWLAPDLLFGQTCGYPFSTQLKGKVNYLATPVYDVVGCQGPYYSSAIIAHKDSGLKSGDLRAKSFAYNSTHSWSGYRTMVLEVGKLADFFSRMVMSGGHRQTAIIVAEGKADIGALDAVCWHLLQQHEPQTAGKLEVVGWTKLQPALPFITANGRGEENSDQLRRALSEVLKDPQNRQICDRLALKDCQVLDPEIYSPMAKVDQG